MNALFYHERTKHYYNRYARSLGYLDWENQPSPYRSYEPTQKFPLTLDDALSCSYGELFEKREPLELSCQTLSSFLRYALGLAAKKRFGASSWELRINASSGNLHPTEAYVVLPPMQGMPQTSALYHYNSYFHHLEQLGRYEHSLEEGSFVIVLSSVIYREMWKYGERCYRYCCLDLGHAYRCLEVSAMLHGWSIEPLELSERELERLVGLDMKERFEERELESGDIAVCIRTKQKSACSAQELRGFVPQEMNNSANRLCGHYQRYEIVEAVDALSKEGVINVRTWKEHHCKIAKKATDVILKRRSAQAFDPYTSQMTSEEFLHILHSVDLLDQRTLLFVYVHNIKGFSQGLYLYSPTGKVPQLRESFVPKELGDALILLEEGDFRIKAKNLSCMQDIASDSAFALSMLADFSEVGKRATAYKERLFEAGRIGQQLYLEATALGYRATGIGCFFDDAIHNLLGVDTNRWQVVYNFTVGKAVVDMRLLGEPPYGHLKREGCSGHSK